MSIPSAATRGCARSSAASGSDLPFRRRHTSWPKVTTLGRKRRRSRRKTRPRPLRRSSRPQLRRTGDGACPRACTIRTMRTRLLAASLLLIAAVAARADFREFKEIPIDPAIETNLRHVAAATLKEFPKLKDEDLAISVVDLTRQSTISRGDYHGDAPFYPASVVKLFIMAEVFHQRKEAEPDVPRALHEMIAVSDNDATAFLIDTISDTCSGPSLSGRALAKFIDKRRVTKKWFATMGYDISAMAKPWSFGPFGRDMQVLGEDR